MISHVSDMLKHNLRFLRRTQASEFVTGFVEAGVGELRALGERGGEASAGQVEFTEPGVGDAAEVQGVGLAPGVLALRVYRAVESRRAGRPAPAPPSPRRRRVGHGPGPGAARRESARSRRGAPGSARWMPASAVGHSVRAGSECPRKAEGVPLGA